MGKWRERYELLSSDFHDVRTEQMRLQDESKKAEGRLQRERERGDNLQRELLAHENETTKQQHDSAVLIDRLLHERDDWHARYDAAMARVDELEALVPAPLAPKRRKMPDERKGGTTVALRIGDKTLVKHCPACEQPLPNSPRCTSFTLTVNPFAPGGPIGEFFLKPSHDENTDLIASLSDLWATASSYALQCGGDIGWITERARYCNDISGGVPMVWSAEQEQYITHPVFAHAKSIMDLAARVIERIRDGKPADKMTAEEAEAQAQKLAEVPT